MRTLLQTSVLFAVICGPALAETYTGKLVDASCAAQHQTAACIPTATTKVFALAASGKMLKLDAAGNAKAAEALREDNGGANRTEEPNASVTSGVTATVTGTRRGDQLRVESIQIQ